MEQNSLPLFLTQILHPPRNILNAHTTLTQLFTTDQSFVRHLIEYLTSETQDKQHTQLFQVITIAHPPLVQNFKRFSQQLQEDIRGGLLNAVVSLHTNLRCVGALGLLIREIVEIDGLEPWIEPFQELLKWIASDELAIMQAGIQFFLFLLKQTNYNKPNSDLPLHKLAPLLLDILYQIFAQSQLTQLIRQKLLYLVLQLVKTFSILDGVEDETVHECFDGTFHIWMGLFIAALQSSINLNIGIKKYIMKILIILFRDMQKYIHAKQKQQPLQIYTIWEFTYRVMPLYLWTHVWERNSSSYLVDTKIKSGYDPIPYYDDDTDSVLPPFEALGHAVLQFLSVITSIPQLSVTVKISIYHLTNVLFHYLLMTDSDYLLWKSNPHHFVQQTTNMDYELTIRNKTIAILNELIEKYGDHAIQAILVISQKFLLNLPEKATTETITTLIENIVELSKIPQITGQIYENQHKLISLIRLSSCDVRQNLKLSGETWRKIEVALLVLGRFSQDIIVFQSKQAGSFDIESFVRGIIKQIRDQQYYTLLKGQSLYCLTRFTQIISIKYRHLFGQLSAAAVSCLSDSYPISIKMIACKALTIFLKKMEKHKLELSQQQIIFIEEVEPLQQITQIPLTNETTSQIVQVLIELAKNKSLRGLRTISPNYLLALFHKSMNQSSVLPSFLNLLEHLCHQIQVYRLIAPIFIDFIQQCLKAYLNIVRSDQKKHLKGADIELIITVLRTANILLDKSLIHTDAVNERNKIVTLLPTATDILQSNEDVQVHISLTIYLKNIIKCCSDSLAQEKDSIERVVGAIRNLLKIPADKSFESASVYVGNLVILVGDKLLKRLHYEILQEVVLKIFKSRTPSVIQSLVLIYARIINEHTTVDNVFSLTGDMESNIRNIVDFLSSFSIENRMGLKILIDKWLLQQSLFRGKYTKISTFMALSKLFLLNDKRIDNLLVIGFNPSHTNVSNDVNAPLKILATLIRCLDNEMGGKNSQNDDDQDDGDYTMKEDSNTLEVNLQKFKEEREEGEGDKIVGGLADRQNQQGSTCYMSAMLQFYDDGEECDDKTEEDLVYLKDNSTQFSLGEYLTDFFQHLAANRGDYLRQCLKGLLREDMRTLQKYVKIA